VRAGRGYLSDASGRPGRYAESSTYSSKAETNGQATARRSAQLVNHYAWCIPSTAPDCLGPQRCSDKDPHKTGPGRPRAAEAECSIGCSSIELPHSPLPLCEAGIPPSERSRLPRGSQICPGWHFSCYDIDDEARALGRRGGNLDVRHLGEPVGKTRSDWWNRLDVAGQSKLYDYVRAVSLSGGCAGCNTAQRQKRHSAVRPNPRMDSISNPLDSPPFC